MMVDGTRRRYRASWVVGKVVVPGASYPMTKRRYRAFWGEDWHTFVGATSLKTIALNDDESSFRTRCAHTLHRIFSAASKTSSSKEET